jgi:hypothetical protein
MERKRRQPLIARTVPEEGVGGIQHRPTRFLRQESPTHLNRPEPQDHHQRYGRGVRRNSTASEPLAADSPPDLGGACPPTTDGAKHPGGTDNTASVPCTG